MILYLLKSAACLLILLLVHQFLLQRESMHRFNRFFLLFSVVVSFLIPIYVIELPAVSVSVEHQMPVILENEVQADYADTDSFTAGSPIDQDLDFREEAEIPWVTIFWTLYLGVTLVFLIRFVRNIRILADKISRNMHVSYRGETLVLLAENTLPFTFLKFIFISKTYFEEGKLTEAIFAHERAHLQEKHSWDVLFIELLLVFIWFHPGLYFARQAIKLNHEFIADQAALQATTLDKYQSQLLSMMVSETSIGLTSSLNFSLTKKRFEMMKRRTKDSTKWIKISILVPLVGILGYFFSEKVTTQAEANKESDMVDVSSTGDSLERVEVNIRLIAEGKIEVDGEPVELAQLAGLIDGNYNKNTLARISADPGVKMGLLSDVQQVLRDNDVRKVAWTGPEGEDKVEGLKDEVYTIVFGSPFKELSKAEYYSQTKFLIKYPDGELEELSYDNLPENYRNGLPDPPGSISKKVPSSELFESWKNVNEFALWLDRKVVPNSKLDEMEFSDIAYFTSSFVHSNARSERFPQNYQVSIYTESGFENTFGKNSSFGKALRGTVTFHSESPKKQEFTISSDPISLYQRDLNRYQERLNSGVPFIEKSNIEQEQLVEMFSDLGARYFRLMDSDKKKAERPVNPHLPYYRVRNDGKVYYKLEKDLSQEEKKQFSKTPPIFPYDKNIVTLSNYLKEFGEFQVKINENRLFAQPSNQEIEGLQSHFRSLEASYNSLPFEERSKVKRASFPYAKIEKDGNVIFKRFEDLTAEELKNLGC